MRVYGTLVPEDPTRDLTGDADCHPAAAGSVSVFGPLLSLEFSSLVVVVVPSDGPCHRRRRRPRRRFLGSLHFYSLDRTLTSSTQSIYPPLEYEVRYGVPYAASSSTLSTPFTRPPFSIFMIHTPRSSPPSTPCGLGSLVRPCYIPTTDPVPILPM